MCIDICMGRSKLLLMMIACLHFAVFPNHLLVQVIEEYLLLKLLCIGRELIAMHSPLRKVGKIHLLFILCSQEVRGDQLSSLSRRR